MNLVGKMIGNRYEILKEVGNGGMAIVYKAKDHILNRYVAVKVLKDEFTTDSDFIKRFNTEAQSAAGLTNPNIVSIYDVGHEEDPDIYYIVMELVKGKTLKEIITKDKRISWKWAVNIAMQIASALQEAHSHGIIHRDIKPHNIIITEDGVAKVTDFGIAKAVSNSTMTAFGTTLGSVHYFSPEQAKGSITDAKSDLYSLGVVMYEMLTGKVPFDADTPVSIALKHMQEEPVPPIELNDEIPQAVNDIVLKAMQKNPIDRYQSAEEMIQDLKKALKDPDGDFVVIENKDGEYTRVLRTVSDKDEPKKKKENKIKAFFREHPRTKVIAFLLGLVLLFVVVFMLTKIALDGGVGTKKVNLPNVVGKTQDEAKSIIEQAGLKMEVGDSEASSEVAEGLIIMQEPPYQSDTKVEKGSTVKITLSTGPETAELPDFKDQDIETVRAEAKKMGLILNESEEFSDKVDENKVISQSVKAGTQVKSGDSVSVVVSKGVEKTTVPTVVGMDEGTAKATISNANLKSEVSYTNDDTKDDGKVVSQSVDQGKEVATGTTVKIVVNKIKKESKTLNIYMNVKKPTTSTETTENPTATISFSINDASTSTTKTINSDVYDNGLKIGSGTGTDKITVKGTITINKKSTSFEQTFNVKDYNNNAKVFLTKEINMDDYITKQEN